MNASGAAPIISDEYWVTTAQVCKAAGICDVTLWRHVKHGNIAEPKKRKGILGNRWTESQVKKFIKRLGKPVPESLA